ncbi:hypothetical protein KIM372_07530 [Bombiscardovia nodaiensis]|uniref:ABC transporter domain-containing protein n=1 Tax=Bombiscardovia nodaiensis TaxID=2932181 RepID=A0ABM8B7R7_9BIFI|nr:hypothetical protein KIM372_07530 [Bombiscardovia nodaiensis]
MSTTATNPGWSVICDQVEKSFGSKKVLTNLDLRVPSGSILGLLGKNGAGKSTLISIMTGLLNPDSGSIRIEGRDPVHMPHHIFGSLIGLAPQDLGIYPNLSVLDNLRGFGGVQGLTMKQAKVRTDELIALMGLQAQAKTPARNLSGGQKRRLHTAIAMLHNPRVLFLDEPTVGADVEARSGILDMVRAMASEGTTIIYTSHYLQEIAALKANLAFLIDGRISVQGGLNEIVRQYARASVRVTFTAEPPAHIPGWQMRGKYIEPDHPISSPEAEIANLFQQPQMRETTVADISVIQPDLESAYMNIMGQSEKTTTPNQTTPAQLTHQGS